MKKVFSLVIILIMIISIFSISIGATEIPQVTVEVRDSKGNIQNNFLPGETMYLNYTIKPENIPVNKIVSSKPVEIVCVVDISGSMEYSYDHDSKPKDDENDRMTIAKESLKDFVEEFRKSNTTADVSISFVTFDGSVRECTDFLNIKETNVDDIINNINVPKNYNGTNGGDGLREAYYNLLDIGQSNAQKYIIFLTDGEFNFYTYTSTKIYAADINGQYGDSITVYSAENGKHYFDYYNFFGRKKTVKTTADIGNYRRDSWSRKYCKINNYLGKTESEIDVFYDGSDNANDKIIASQYAYDVSSKLIANDNDGIDITTFVIGIGDIHNTNQANQNKNIAMKANNVVSENGYYFAPDSDGLSVIYKNLGSEILSDIQTETVQCNIEFPDNYQFSMGKDEFLYIKSIKVNGDNYSGLTLQNNSLVGELPKFIYTLSDDEKYYEASPLTVSIEIQIPKDYKNTEPITFGSENSYISFDIEGQDGKIIEQNIKIQLNTVSIRVVDTSSIATVNASLIIDSINNTAKLSMTTDKDCDKLYIKKNIEDKKPIKDFDLVKKDTEVSTELSNPELQSFSDGKIYIIMERSVDGRTITDIETVTIMEYIGHDNIKLNYDSDTQRYVSVKVKGAFGLGNFTSSMQNKFDTYYEKGFYYNEIVLKEGINNNCYISAKNEYNNMVTVEFNTDYIYAVRPVANINSISSDKLSIKLGNNHKNIKKVKVTLYDYNDNFIKEVDMIKDTNNDDIYSCDINVDDVKSILVDVLDEYNNGRIINIAAISDSTIVDSGLYIKSTNSILKIDVINTVAKCSYPFATKFTASGNNKIVITALNTEGLDLESPSINDTIIQKLTSEHNSLDIKFKFYDIHIYDSENLNVPLNDMLIDGTISSTNNNLEINTVGLDSTKTYVLTYNLIILDDYNTLKLKNLTSFNLYTLVGNRFKTNLINVKESPNIE